MPLHDEMMGGAAIADRRRTPPLTRRTRMEPKVRQEIETAVRAINDALTSLVTFTMTLRPTLRNEIFQLLGHHIERAREARERLHTLVADPVAPSGDPPSGGPKR
jgi:hypothetical protein